LLAANGIVVTAEKAKDSRSRSNAKGNYIYEGDFNITYINMDNPEDKFTTLIESHAMDAGDKAPGKAITYATKTSMLKVFQVETGLDDESRAEKGDVDFIDNDQVQVLYNLIVDAGTQRLTPKGEKLARAYKFNHLSEIKSSKYDEILRKAS